MSPIRWEAPGPYAVAFSTRSGGVSEAPFDTLNLGRLTGDEPERVAENRLRLCAETGVVYHPLADRWQLSSDLDVNYMLTAEKPV